MTNETAPERIWATYNDAFGINWQDGQFTTSEQPACGRYTPYIREDISEIRTERVRAELEAAQARIAELEGALRKIGNQKPNFDYAEVPAGEKLEVNNMRPGSPYDRGMDEAYKTLTKMARAALQEGKG